MTKEELRTRRENLELSLRALAKKLDLSWNTLWRWESGWIISHPKLLDYALKGVEAEMRKEEEKKRATQSQTKLSKPKPLKKKYRPKP